MSPTVANFLVTNNGKHDMGIVEACAQRLYLYSCFS